MCLIVFFGVRLVDLWAYIPRILGRRLTQVGEAENYSFQRTAPWSTWANGQQLYYYFIRHFFFIRVNREKVALSVLICLVGVERSKTPQVWSPKDTGVRAQV